jgi:hypothetical protein
MRQDSGIWVSESELLDPSGPYKLDITRTKAVIKACRKQGLVRPDKYQPSVKRYLYIHAQTNDHVKSSRTVLKGKRLLTGGDDVHAFDSGSCSSSCSSSSESESDAEAKTGGAKRNQKKQPRPKPQAGGRDDHGNEA